MSRIPITYPKCITGIFLLDPKDTALFSGENGLYEYLFENDTIRIQYNSHPDFITFQIIRNVVTLFLFKKDAQIDLCIEVTS